MCSYDQSLVTVAFLGEKLSQPQFYKDLTKKSFFEGWCWFKSNNLGLALGSNLEILHQCGKRVKTKSETVFKANSYVCRNYRRKRPFRPFWNPHPE